jgi:hypothetical protein
MLFNKQNAHNFSIANNFGKWIKYRLSWLYWPMLQNTMCRAAAVAATARIKIKV